MTSVMTRYPYSNPSISSGWYTLAMHVIGPSYKSHNASDRYPTMHDFVTKMCTFMSQSGALWDMRLVHCGICEIDLFNCSVCFTRWWMKMLYPSSVRGEWNNICHNLHWFSQDWSQGLTPDIHTWILYICIFSCDQAALWMVFVVCPSVCLSRPFHYVPIIISSWNFQELLPMTEVISMQKVKVRGQRSRSQRSKPNLTVSGL